jgi:hypothetical protein
LHGSDQFSKVLNCGDEQILDRLLEESSPTSAFEAMSVSSVSKTTFHQMLSAFPIELGSFGIRLSTRSIQEVLIAMPLNAAASLRTRTELPQPTTQTDTSLGDVFPTQARRVQAPWLHELAGRTQEGVACWLIAEHRLGIDPIATATAGATGQ